MSEVADSAAEQSSFEAAMAAALAAQGDQPEAQAAPEVAADPVKTEPVAAKPDVTAPEPAPAPPSARELERIAALEAREAKLRESESRYRDLDSREAKVKELEGKSTANWDRFVSDPVGHIRSMRPDLSAAEAARVAEQIYYYSLGDKAPTEHRQQQAVTRAKAEVKSDLEQLRAEVQQLREERSRAEAEHQLSSYQAELRAGAAAAKDAPIVASLAQRNPDRAAQLLLEVARREAHESKARGDAEPVVLTPEQAVAKLEAALKAQRDDLYGPAADAQPHATQSQLSPTLTNKDARAQAPKIPPDSLDDKALRAAALKAAGLEHIPIWD